MIRLADVEWCHSPEWECEWVKEDVADGNNGYFKVYPGDRENARTLTD